MQIMRKKKPREFNPFSGTQIHMLALTEVLVSQSVHLIDELNAMNIEKIRFSAIRNDRSDCGV